VIEWQESRTAVFVMEAWSPPLASRGGYPVRRWDVEVLVLLLEKLTEILIVSRDFMLKKALFKHGYFLLKLLKFSTIIICLLFRLLESQD